MEEIQQVGASTSAGGRGSKPTRLGTLWSRSIGAFGTMLRGKKKRTISPFLDTLNREMSAAVADIRRDVQHQVWGDQALWHARRMPRFWKIRKKWHKHSGEWAKREETWWYEDCECCGQPVKHGWDEDWWRTCDVCGAYESRDKIPTTRKGRFSWRDASK